VNTETLTHILQSSVSTRLRYGGIFSCHYCKFSAHSGVEIIMRILVILARLLSSLLAPFLTHGDANQFISIQMAPDYSRLKEHCLNSAH